MSGRPFQIRKLDVAAFATEGAQLTGNWPLADLVRLASATVAGSAQGGVPVAWQARAEQRRLGSALQPWLHVHATATVQLACQRCLQPLTEILTADRWIRFVEGEEAAADLDADSEDDVLALTRSLDLQWLIEDELILALPLVPRHADCSIPQAWDAGAQASAVPPAEEGEQAHPFAVLAALKGRGKASPD